MRGWLVAGLCLLVLLGACGDTATERERTIRLGMAQKALSLDPRFATDAASSRINRLLYRRLVEFDQRMEPMPGIASWQEISPTQYRFHLLEQGREFHDGRRLTSLDVAAAYQFVLRAENASPYRLSLASLDHLRVIDEDWIEFFLKWPDPLFPGRLGLGIPPRDWQSGSTPVGSGPFQFLGWPDPDRLLLKRRRDGLTVEFVRIPDPTVRVMKLLAGELDLLQNDLAPEMIDYLRVQPGVSVRVYPSNNYAYLGFNLRDKATSDPRVRQAVAHALDRAEIIRYFFRGLATPASGLLPESHWAASHELAPYPHDPQRARALLAEAGYTAKHPLRLSYKVSTDPQRQRIAAIIQKQLAEVGIDLRIRAYEWGSFYGDIKAGRFQMYSLVWVGVSLPDIFRQVFHSASVAPLGANRGYLQNAAIDRLIEDAEAEPDRDRQAALFGRLQVQLHQLLPYVPLWHEDHVVVYRDRLLGYHTGPAGNYDELLSAEWAK